MAGKPTVAHVRKPLLFDYDLNDRTKNNGENLL